MRKNGAEIYNRTALDNTLIYSGVIDMPAGRGVMTLEFSVSAWLVNNWYPTASISDLLVVVMKNPQPVSRLAEFYNPYTGARNGAFFVIPESSLPGLILTYGVYMAVQISGVLKDGAGKPVQACSN